MSARGANSTLGVWTFLLLVAVSGVAPNISARISNSEDFP